MKKLIISTILLASLASLSIAQTPAPATGPNWFVSLGAEYNHYTPVAQFAATANFGAKVSDHFWSITTLVMQPSAATIRSGVGYSLVQNNNLRLIMLGDAGITTQTNQIAGAIPIPTAVTLGNLGGGALISYDLGGAWTKLKDKGLYVNAGVRIAAVTATSVMPAAIITIGKTF